MSVSDVHGMLGPAAMAVTAPFLGSFILLAIKNKRFASISSLIATSDRPTAAAVPCVCEEIYLPPSTSPTSCPAQIHFLSHCSHTLHDLVVYCGCD